jgi:hypothetical protein
MYVSISSSLLLISIFFFSSYQRSYFDGNIPSSNDNSHVDLRYVFFLPFPATPLFFFLSKNFFLYPSNRDAAFVVVTRE